MSDGAECADRSGINQAKYTGDVKSYPVDAADGWTVPLQGFTVNGQRVDIGEPVRANVSTTSKMFYADRAVVEKIYALIPGAKPLEGAGNPYNVSWVFPCENVPNISVSLNIGGDEYAMAAVDVVLGIDRNNTYGDGWDTSETPKTGSCIGVFRSE